MDNTRKIAIACDHAGFDLKSQCIAWVRDMGYEALDLGTDSIDSVDYPDFAKKMGDVISDGGCQTGILICGSGIGISIAANRFPSVRCALCHDETTARLARQHNDANVIALGSRTTGIETAKAAIEVFLSTDFDGGERHTRRINKLSDKLGDT